MADSSAQELNFPTQIRHLTNIKWATFIIDDVLKIKPSDSVDLNYKKNFFRDLLWSLKIPNAKNDKIKNFYLIIFDEKAKIN